MDSVSSFFSPPIVYTLTHSDLTGKCHKAQTGETRVKAINWLWLLLKNEEVAGSIFTFSRPRPQLQVEWWAYVVKVEGHLSLGSDPDGIAFLGTKEEPSN